MIGISMVFSFWYDRYAIIEQDEILRSVNCITTLLTIITAFFYFVSLLCPEKLTFSFAGKFIFIAVPYSLIIIVSDRVFGYHDPITGYQEILDKLTTPTVLFRLFACSCIIALGAYCVLAIVRLYHRYKHLIKETYSFSEGIDLKWISKSITLFVIFALFDLIWIVNPSAEIRIVFNFTTIILIWYIFWLGFRQGKTPLIHDLTDKKEGTASQDNKTDIRQTALQRKVKEDLCTFFNNDKPYLNPELSLTNVATALGVNNTYLSKLINREFKMNFYTFVNNHRIDYAISLIKQSDYKITGDMLYTTSGFRSRSVFYKQFHEKTGLTPKEYIRQSLLSTHSI